MQAASLFSSLVRQRGLADTSSTRASGDFGAALTEWILGTAPAVASKEASGKKITGKSDSRIPSAPNADEQFSAPRATANPALLAQFAVIPLPAANACIAVPKAEGTVTAVGKNPGSETDGAMTAGTHTATATTSVALPLASSPLSLDDFKSQSSQIDLTPGIDKNPIPGPSLAGHAPSSVPRPVAAAVPTSSALPPTDFKFALRQVQSTTAPTTALTTPPTANVLSSATPPSASLMVATAPSEAQGKFVSVPRPVVEGSISTETPANPLPRSQNVSGRSPRVNVKSLTVASPAAPLPRTADSADTSPAVSNVAGEKESEVVGDATPAASFGATRVLVPVATKAVVQGSAAPKESGSSLDDLSHMAAPTTVPQLSSPILQRSAVDVYKMTSAVSHETNPQPVTRIFPSPAPQRGLAQQTNDVTAPDVPPQSVAATARTSNQFPSSITGAVVSPAEAKSARSMVKDVFVPAGVSAVQPKQSESSSSSGDLGKSDSTLPTPLTPATATATDTSTEKPVAVSPPIASAPDAVGPSLQPAQDPLAGPIAPVPPWANKISPVAPDKTKSGAPALGGNDLRAAASRAAQAQVQLVPESPGVNKTLRTAASEATPGSKDNAEKKAGVSSSPSDRPAPESPVQTPLNRDGAVVIPHAPAPAAPTHTPSPETRQSPPPPQLPDATPAASDMQPPARLTTDAGGNVQMHVGIRTAAFGAVEIYTSVHQNQVGLTVQGERGMAHWFSSEVQNIESGLKDHHLHLTMTQMDKGSSGLQTSTGSQQQQNPQRNFSALRGWQYRRTPEREKIEVAEIVSARLPAWSGANQFSIHV